MTEGTDYYTSLARAVARLGYDSFEARGAIYDHARNELFKRLSSADPPVSDEDIAREQAALLEAIREIEFGHMAARPAPPRADILGLQPRVQGAIGSPLVEDGIVLPRARPYVSGRVVGRIVVALIVLAAVAMGAAFLSTRPELMSLAGWRDWLLPQSAPVAKAPAEPRGPAQRAVLYEEDASNPAGKTASGSSYWRIRSVPGTAGSAPESVVTLDAEIPERQLALTVTVRRDPEPGTISHLVEFRFMPSKSMPADAIADVIGLMMKKDELVRGAQLRGQVVKVAPGVFLMGLSGAEADAQQNLRLLRSEAWLDIPIVFKSGSRALLAVEKGAEGSRVIEQALDAWGSPKAP